MSRKIQWDKLLENQALAGNESIHEVIDSIATALVHQAGKVQKDQKVLVWFDKPGAQLAQAMSQKALQAGAEVKIFLRDYEGDARTLSAIDDDQIHTLFTQEAELMKWAENVLIVRNPANPEAMSLVSSQKTIQYYKYSNGIHDRRSRGDVDWTLFLWPTQYEADKEGLAYKDYFDLVMEACNQPWQEIKQAQEILKRKLDNGRQLEFYADEYNPDPQKRTAITMSIEGMTFCNSTIDRNYPGSEVFSAPVLDTVNGQIYAEGMFLHAGYLMKNLYMKVENGRITEAFAEEGNEGFQTILNRDTAENGFGSRYFGEVALGTNRGLQQRLFNPLLTEKVGGSFHLALGHCYTHTHYKGEPVSVNNGNTGEKTSLHWDVTVLMHLKSDQTGGGRVVLDGEVIQENGSFIDPSLSILSLRK